MAHNPFDRVIAVSNEKGGVGKSTFVANVAGSLARRGNRVLLIGLDAQRSQTLFRDLGLSHASDDGAALADAMTLGTPLKVIPGIRPNLDVVPDGPELERVLIQIYGRQYTGEGTLEDAFELLRPALKPLAATYDYILLDCPPSTMPLIRAAMGVARWLIIPTASDAGSIDGLAGTTVTFVDARPHNPMIELLGIVLMQSVSQARVTRGVALDTLTELFEGTEPPLFENFTRFSEPVAVQARRNGLLFHELAEQGASDGWRTNSTGLAQDYEDITDELINLIASKENHHG